MKNTQHRILLAIISMVFIGALSGVSAETDHIADFIRYEVKVNTMVPDNPDDGVGIGEILKSQSAFAELLVASGNKELQLAYVRQSIIGYLEMIPFEEWDLTLEGFKKEMDRLTGDETSKPDMGDYVRFKAQLGAAYAVVFKKEHDMSFSPKIEGIVTRLRKNVP